MTRALANARRSEYVSRSYAGEESLPLAQGTTAQPSRRGEGIWDPQARDCKALPKLYGEITERVKYAGGKETFSES